MSARAYTEAEIERIAKALAPEAYREQEGWVTRCPCEGHEDVHPSLKLDIGRDGRLLCYCRGGCGKGEVWAAIKARGLLPQPNGHDAGGGPEAATSDPGGEIVARYDYVDAQGRRLFQVVRFHPKAFRQCRIGKDGKPAWNLKGVRRVLYRLPEVLAADEVVIVEGEKDADNLRTAGFVATTCAMGARKWKAAYSDALAGKAVVIVPDRDGPGRKHAEDVAASLQGKARSIKVVELGEGKDVSDWLAAGHDAAELRALIGAASVVAGKPAAIRIKQGRMAEVVEAAAAALVAMTGHDPFSGHFRRGAHLVHVARLATAPAPAKDGVRRQAGSPAILVANVDGLRVALAKASRWERFDVQRQDWVPTDVTKDITRGLLSSAPGMGAIPVLTGIVEAPTLRPDGTILSEPGYDAATGLLLDTGGVDFPAVPERPTKEDAEEALRLIQDVIRAFPFKDEASKAAGVALMITPNVRKACRAVPLTVISAPKMAAGKTLLACVAGYARLGRMPTLMPPAGDPNEERKRLLGVLLDGDEIVVVDNVDGKMKSDALCTAVTEPVFTDRMLGVNDKVTARSGTMFVATGNNLAVVGDLSSRVVGCLLDPGCEHPEERRFDVNLHETVPAMLPRLVVAALTIVRAYLAAGEPMKGKLPNFARFEDWSRLVREPLKWLGMDDPCGGRDAVEARDTERAVLASLLLAWHESFGDEHVLTGEAVKRATREPPAANGATPTADELGRRERLLQAMEAAAPGAGKVSPVGLGRFMGRYEGRIEDGLRFVAKQVHKQSAWAALPTEGADTPAGSETSSDVNPRLGGDTEMGEMNPASRKRTVPTDACESCSGTGRITAVSRARLTH